ncbi:methylated-DNA--[protein]-cysteine S-methyltransferase [Liquorilactobacillus mali]|uniref:methylated-DNA--[protein]-cysteine S-methyltransferase n=1 Tax=Liquorilactobacillus mali TaxID=1618 RepID=UPI002954DEA1|nr:methylated-DNA--[protein]-cysteine S-methyltransferase [Liquorilactobacillus mali]MDV7757876.1 methylated-DNA--[protein]-cysteine S-methyltransferase [Liquorilactobacillus mali]
MRLFTNYIDTPIGKMVSISDDSYLYLLQFTDSKKLDLRIQQVCKFYKAELVEQPTAVYLTLKKQLTAYFLKEIDTFSVPLVLNGTSFQKQVWNILQSTHSGELLTYKKIAELLGSSGKSQAVGNANGANKIAIIIPCHRVINDSGSLGGYAGGPSRKMFLLSLESKNVTLF